MNFRGKKINEIERKLFEPVQEKNPQNTKGTAFICIMLSLNIREKTEGKKEGKILSCIYALTCELT